MKPAETKTENLFPSLLSDFFDADNLLGRRWFEREFKQTVPAVNIKENPRGFDIEFAAPGFRKEDFKVNVENNVLTVQAEKKEEQSESRDRYTRKEFSYNSFSRSFTLPPDCNPDKIEANYRDGLLNLTLPKKEEAKAKAKKEIRVD